MTQWTCPSFLKLCFFFNVPGTVILWISGLAFAISSPSCPSMKVDPQKFNLKSSSLIWCTDLDPTMNSHFWSCSFPLKRLHSFSKHFFLSACMRAQLLSHIWLSVIPWTGKKPWCCERLWAGGKGDSRGWDGWMASPIQWTQVWASSGRQWRTRKPGVLQSMGSQRVGDDWATEQPPCIMGTQRGHT